MRNLLSAACGRYLHDYFTLLTLICSAVFGCMCVLTSIGYGWTFRIDRMWFVAILMLCAALTALAVGREFRDHTFRNKLTVGHSKAAVFFSELIAAMLLSGLSFILSAGPLYLATGEFRRDLPASAVAQMYLLLLCIYLFFTVLSVTVCMLSGSRVAAVIAVGAVMLLMYQLSNVQREVLNRSNREYEYTTNVYETTNSEGNTTSEAVQMPNPRYIALTDTQRNALLFADHCNAFSSLIHFTDIYNNYSVYSGYCNHWMQKREDLLHFLRGDIFAQCLVMVLLASGGAALFRRKNLK